MPLDPNVPYQMAAAILSAIAQLIGLRNNLTNGAGSEKQRKALAPVIDALPDKAKSTLNEFVERIDKFETSLRKAGVDLNHTPNSLQSEVSFLRRRWYQLPKDFDAHIAALSTELEHYFDDVIAVLNCCGGEELLSFGLAQEYSMMLEKQINPTKPMKEILGALKGNAQDLLAQLRDKT